MAIDNKSLIDCFSGNYKYKRNSSTNIVFYNKKDENFFEEFNISEKKDGKEYLLVIKTEDTRPQLSFFTNFKIDFLNTPIDSTLFSYPENLNELISHIDAYFYYRDILLDIRKIMHGKYYFKNSDALSNTSPLLNFMLYKKGTFQKRKIVNFPQIDDKTGRKYLDRFKKLIKVLKPKFSLTYCYIRKGPIPFSSSIYKNNFDIRMNIILFNHFVGHCFDNFLEIEFQQNSEISFILSYLHHYNLIDKFYIEMQKKLLAELSVVK